MFEELESCAVALKAAVAGFEPAACDGDQAMRFVALFAEVERLGAAGKVLAAERVSACEVWRRGGWRSMADWLGRQTGSDRGRCTATVETAGRLGDCPVVQRELRAGRLSEAQAHAIVDALGVRPDAERHLIDFALAHSVRQLAEECRRMKTAAENADDTYGDIHRSRSFRHWTGRDGAVCFSGRLTPDAGAGLVNAIEDRKAKIVGEARRHGQREPFDAYAADALVELVAEDRVTVSGSSQPRAMVIVEVSYEALLRGAVGDGDRCEIRGVGPIPLSVANHLATDAILRVLVTKGCQPVAVTPGLRTIPRPLRILLEARDRECVVPGCDVTRGLQIDHDRPFAALGPTDLANCNRICSRHHAMKTYQGWSLGGMPGARTWNPPDDYRDPELPDSDPDTGVTLATDPWSSESNRFGMGDDPAGEGDDRGVLVGAVSSGALA